MKTQILRLDLHDDVTSTCDKMNWGQAGRILLVWPKEGRLLRRRVDLTLIQRHSSSLGAQLALVTNDPVVRFNARHLAIPAYKSLRQAQNAHWRVDRRLRKRPPPIFEERLPVDIETLEALRATAHSSVPTWLGQPVARLTIFTLGVLAVLALAAFLLPGAEVDLTPQTKTQSLTLTIRASPTQQTINISGVIPARTMDVVVEGRDHIKTSGTTRNPEQTASGEVVFTNLSDKPVKIPTGLVVRNLANPPIRFATIQTGELEAGPGITTTLAVRSLIPGASGNLPANELSAIEGNLGLSLAATNPQPTRGGYDSRLPAPTFQDRQTLYEVLEGELRQSAQAEMEAQLASGDLLFTQTLTITRILEQAYTPANNDPSEQVDLNLRIKYQALSVSKSDMDHLATVLLDANLPEGYIALPDSLAIKQATPVVIENENQAIGQITARWQFIAQRVIHADIAPSQAINMILGVTPAEAIVKLGETWPLSTAPVIQLNPPWWPRLPILPSRISIHAHPRR